MLHALTMPFHRATWAQDTLGVDYIAVVRCAERGNGLCELTFGRWTRSGSSQKGNAIVEVVPLPVGAVGLAFVRGSAEVGAEAGRYCVSASPTLSARARRSACAACVGAAGDRSVPTLSCPDFKGVHGCSGVAWGAHLCAARVGTVVRA